jgi:Na+/proline symporter
MFDIYKPLFGKNIDQQRELLVSRIFTVIAGIILTFVAFIFIQLNQSVVEIALGIASITYGGLLGTFLLGLLSKNVTQRGALWGFSAGIMTMLLVSLPPIIYGQPPLIHWTWFVLLGSTITIVVGSFFRKKFSEVKS